MFVRVFVLVQMFPETITVRGTDAIGHFKKKPQPLLKLGLSIQIRQRPTLPYGNRIVPSALEGLTAEFGMGSGVTPPLSPPETD